MLGRWTDVGQPAPGCHSPSMFPGWADALIPVTPQRCPRRKAPGGLQPCPIPGLATPKPGRHLRIGTHSRQPSCFFNMQYQPGLHIQIRFCFKVHAWVSTWSVEAKRQSRVMPVLPHPLSPPGQPTTPSQNQVKGRPASVPRATAWSQLHHSVSKHSCSPGNYFLDPQMGTHLPPPMGHLLYSRG